MTQTQAKTPHRRTATDEEIIAALMTGPTIQAAADAVGMPVRTLHDRMRTREFKALHAATRAQILRNAVEGLQGRLSEAVDTVAEIMTNPDNNPAVRLQAAQTILNNASKFAQQMATAEDTANALYGPPTLADIDFT